MASVLIPGLASGTGVEAQEVTLVDAAREAVAWHPSLIEAIGRLNASAEEVEVAEAGYLPQVRAGINSGYDSSITSEWRPRAQLSISQMLYDFGKVSSSVRAAEAGTAAGRSQVLLAVDSLVRDTSYTVIEIQRGAALRQIALGQLESIEDIYNLVRQRYQQGAATKSDALQARARVEAAQSTLSEIAAEQRRWNSNLAYILGRDEAPAVTADVPEWLLESCGGGEPDWSEVPRIMQAEAERRRALAQLEQARAARLPTVSFGGSTAADIQAPFSGEEEYSFGINISSDLFSGGATRARAQGAAYSLGAAEAAEANARNEVNRLLAEARSQVSSYNDVLETLISRESSMSETGRLYRLQYLQMGTRTLVDLLNAEQELHQVRFDIVNTRHDLRRLGVDCLFNSGKVRAAFGLSGMTVRGVTL